MRVLHVLNLGAGVQSTALSLMAREGRLPCDVAIFADTGEEPASVYRHLEAIDFDALTPNKLDALTVGECHGVWGN